MREDGRIRFAKEIRERVDSLRDAVRSVKGELLGKGIITQCISIDFIVINRLQMVSPMSLQLSRKPRMSTLCQAITRRSLNGLEYRQLPFSLHLALLARS